MDLYSLSMYAEPMVVLERLEAVLLLDGTKPNRLTVIVQSLLRGVAPKSFEDAIQR